MGKDLNNKNQFFLICLILMLTTLAVYYQVHNFTFVDYDDSIYVYKNFNIQDGITLKAVKWAFTAGLAANWHPITWLSHMLDWQLYGGNAGGHHITNVIFHIVNTLLLFIVLKLMTGTLWQSAFVAALFALHPLHVESVAWVSERKDVLSTFFWLLTTWAYVRFVGRPKASNYLLIVVFLALGLMSKPMLVTLPFVLLLLDYWPLNRLNSARSLPSLLVEKIPLFVMVLASSVVTCIVQKKGGAMQTIEGCNYSLRFANAFISYLRYIEKMIWPSRLIVLYPHPGLRISAFHVAVSVLFLLVVTIFVIRLAKKHRYLVTGWFWYIGTLVPVIGIIQVGNQAMADRYSYIPLTGLFIIIAWALPDLLKKWRYKKAALTLSATLVITALTICTYFQLRYWQNTITLFQHALVTVIGDNYSAHMYLADYLTKQGNLDEAVSHYAEAVRIRPDLLSTHLRMGSILAKVGRLDEAVAEYRKCLQIKPDSSEALNDLGVILGRQGKIEQAVECLTEAVRIKPDYAEAHTNLGFALGFQGKMDEAANHLTEALRLAPDSALAHYHLGSILAQKGKASEAVGHFEDSLRLQSDWLEPMNELAWLLASSADAAIRNPDKAVKLALRACELTDYKKLEFLDTLAVAYAAAGTFDKAVETAQKALQLCPSSGQEKLKREIENRLDLFKGGKSYIESK